MDYAECAKRLRFRADSGDMGRKPDPDCDLRIAAVLLDRAQMVEAELRAAADAKDDAEFQHLKPWFYLLQSASEANQIGMQGGGLNAARILRDGAAKLLGVTL